MKGDFESKTGKYEDKFKIKTKDKNEIMKLIEQHNLNQADKGIIEKLETNEKNKKHLIYFHCISLQKKASNYNNQKKHFEISHRVYMIKKY